MIRPVGGPHVAAIPNPPEAHASGGFFQVPGRCKNNARLRKTGPWPELAGGFGFPSVSRDPDPVKAGFRPPMQEVCQPGGHGWPPTGTGRPVCMVRTRGQDTPGWGGPGPGNGHPRESRSAELAGMAHRGKGGALTMFRSRSKGWFSTTL
jgi:hypothetical protein